MIRRPPRSTLDRSSAASDVYKRQYFYFATTFVYPPGRWWGYLFGDLRWALLSAGITALAVLFHRGKLKAKPIWLGNSPATILSIYVVWMAVQSLWALDPAEHT